ncbi:hypothetical protein LTR70_008020 [Exophiala xenobiotica]|uniref:Allantoate permease n=1 Tax=Lithohypha guttulata TaxID=1690604 RepID=A0ABR0KLJ9_9EURO|nr:hypothetical protein LTR24_001123 [Lithohypha guttulata]KAK5312765.1 hypothetical protein LTR70_008020 [Exophiala xenobiotica]
MSTEKDHANYGRMDKEVARYASDTAVEVSPEESRRLRRMIDKRVLLIMITTYFIQALDKGTLSFAAIMGIRTDANLIGQQVPIAKYLGINIILWGLVLACHAACSNFTQLVAVRTLLGIFECVCQPAFLVLSSMWYKREEQAQTIAYWYMMNGGQQIVGGLLAYCFSLLKNGAIKSWQALFITYGSFSVLWGVFVIFWMPDSPMRAKCFSEEDKKLMVERVRSNQTGLQNKKFRLEQVKEAFLDPQLYCRMLIAICTTLPTSGLGAFYGIVVSGLGFSVLETQLLAMVLGVVIILILLSSAFLVKKYKQNCFIMGVYVIPSFIGTVVLMTVKNTDTATRAGLLISYYIVLTLLGRTNVVYEYLQKHCRTDQEDAGPQVFLTYDAPRYFIAFSTHMGCYALLVLVIIYLRWHLKRENKKKDEMAEFDARNVHAFEDLTDRENPNFRYIY